MRKFFGFLFFLIGATALVLIYLIKANLIAKSTVPFLEFVFQTREIQIISVVAFLILLFIGLLMIGRVLFGFMLLLIGLAGMIFPLLTRFGPVAVPSGQIFQSLLKDNFYITLLIGLVIFAIGIFMLTMKRKKG